MNRIFTKYMLLIFLGFSLTNCLKSDLEDTAIENENNAFETIIIPDNFDFSTTKDVNIELKAPAIFTGAVFDIFTVHNEAQISKLATGTFDKNQMYSSLFSIPAYIDSIVIISRYIGLDERVFVPIEGELAVFDYNILYQEYSPEKSFYFGLKSASVSEFSYMGAYNAIGYPGYLFKVNDHAWESLLSNLNQTLPEGISIVETKPQFIASGAQTNLVLKEKSKVYVTFAGEITDLESALGYYIHDGSKPLGKQHIVIFPNASGPGSGGSLHNGDQVLLGEFPANTTIGWFLVPNGWNKSKKLVVDSRGVYYSDSEFNPENATSEKQHMVLLKDIQNEVIVLGFEDNPRDNGQSDNDFNDAVFYITLDNLNAADFTNVSATTSPVDTDGDGIIDSLDEYPLDPNLAFNNNTVSGAAGSLAFEDLWPSMGDFDFNDLVIDYHFNPITDVNNLVKLLEIQLNVRHIGASFHNGFAFEIPISASLIKSVTGAVFTSNYVTLAANGTESGSANAVIFGFDDGWMVKNQTLTIQVTFINPVTTSSIGTFPYNPFLIVNGDRGREVHLADKPPTSKANMNFFGQNSDHSNPSAGRYYRTDRNLPWAINIAGNFAIPVEKNGINKGYLKFVDWAESAGIQYSDWYLDLSGYRDLNFLY